MKSTYKKILTSSGKFRINLGLDRIKAILELLDNPQKKSKFIHIAGTNGKGSTSKLINDFLIEHFKDKKIGLFTSPHMFSYCERIKINNKNIDEDEFNIYINKINDIANENNIDLSEFELITAVAFYYFALNKADYVVLEVGLGGLYDATNIIADPLAVVITTIDFDHTQRLGNTIEEIAYQKAGIIKGNSKVIISKNNLGFETIQKEIIKKNAKLIETVPVEIEFKDFQNNYALINNKKYQFNLLGSYQKDNLSLALTTMKALDIKPKEAEIEQVLKNVRWDFRLQYLKDKNLLIDGSHNPNGIKALREFLDNINRKITFIFGCLNNKDYSKMLEILLKKEDEFYFFEFDYPNSLKISELPEKFRTKAKLLKTKEQVQKVIDNTDNLKVVCGSLYMEGILFSKYPEFH